MRTLVIAAALGLLFAGTASAQHVDVTGRWDMVVNTDQGSIPATLTISSKGETLAGSIAGPQGEVPVDISLKDKAIVISFSMQTQNGAIDITMDGTVNGDQMSGNVSFGNSGAAWSAKRAAAQSGQKPPEGQKPAPTMTGTWQLETHHSAGTSTPSVTITQTGDKLAGKYVGSYGESELTGTIKDNKEFTFRVTIGTEQKVEVVYTGTLDGDTIKGSMTMGEMGEGTFTGKRK
jgi:hypothetical protein